MAPPSVIPYEDVAAHALARSGDVALIAVDGPAGSGKSTFARRLAAGREATILEIDDFLTWEDLETWWPRFLVEALDPLSAGRDVRVQVRDWAADPYGSGLGPWRELAAAPLVIVEGVGSARVDIADQLAASVWVEADPSLRLRRGVEREGEALRDRWLAFMRMEDEFFARDGTKARADYWVVGAPTEPHDPARAFVGERRRRT